MESLQLSQNQTTELRPAIAAALDPETGIGDVASECLMYWIEYTARCERLEKELGHRYKELQKRSVRGARVCEALRRLMEALQDTNPDLADDLPL